MSKSSTRRRKLTQKQFWNILSKIKAWRLIPPYSLRKYDKSGYIVCPLCAVANYVSKTNKHRLDYGIAAEYLGLSEEFASNVAEAVDDGYLTPYRKRLIRVCKPKVACS